MRVQGKVWGDTRCVFAAHDVEVHRIAVRKGGYCSRHLHHSKHNMFYVDVGELIISLWQPSGQLDLTHLKAGESCDVPPGVLHKFAAIKETIAWEIYFVELDQEDIHREDEGGVAV